MQDERTREQLKEALARLTRHFEEVAVSEQHYRDLFENAQVGIYRTTPDGKIVLANPAIVRLLGYDSLEDLRQRDLEREGYHPRHARDEYKRLLERDGKISGFEAIWRTRDGRLLHVRESASAIRDDEGNVVAYEGTVEDISRRKQYEQELHAEKERLDVTLRSIAEAVIATDTEGLVSMMNDRAQILTGWLREEAVGQNMGVVLRLSREETREWYGNLARMVLDTGEVWDLADSAILTSRDGTEKVVTWSMAPIQDPLAGVCGVVFVLRDISERRRLERELARIEKLEAVGLLAGGIAHDFNNLLTSVLGNLTLAKLRSTPGSEAVERLTAAEQAVTSARSLTQQLLTFARGGSPVKENVQVGGRVQETVALALRGARTTARVDLADDLHAVEADLDQLGRALANLIINADEALGDGGEIRVAVRNVSLGTSSVLPLSPGAYVRIGVADDGPGIPAEDLARIFDPFFSTKDGRTGLGLAISHSIVNNHGGHIEVVSSAGAGAEFRVYLPSVEAEAIVEVPAPPRGGRVLVMDDEPMICEILAEALPMFGYEVEFARDGRAAMDHYRSAMGTADAFDVVIMDLRIQGGMGGEEAIQNLRQIDPDIRAIVSSGYSDDPIMANHADHGFQAVLRKPYKIMELRDVLAGVLAG